MTDENFSSSFISNESNSILRLPGSMRIMPPESSDTEEAHSFSLFTLSEELHDDDFPLQAEIVDDTTEQEQIAQEVQQRILAQCAVATMVSADDAKAAPNNNTKFMRLVVAFLICGAISAGVCGSGYCSSASLASYYDDSDDRIKDVVDLIRSVTMIPNEEALVFVTEDDFLKLHAKDHPERIIQRYALATIWFTNGPWGMKPVLASANAWFSTLNECIWEGIICDDEGSVTSMSLDDRQLTGRLANDVGLLTALTAITLSRNSLTGSLEDMLDSLTKLTLTVLELESNQLDGSVPETISNFTALQVLNIRDNQIDGDLPESLSSMTGLETFNAAFNAHLGGVIPSSLAVLTALTHLDLRACDFVGSLPDIFDQLTNLQMLGIGNMKQPSVSLSTLPLSGLSELTNLVFLESSTMMGPLPSEIGKWWPNMASFQLSNVGISGTLPSSIARWTSLRKFDVSKNSLTGTVPEEVFTAWANTIESFKVSENNLWGRVLEKIGLWTGLRVFRVGSNDFSGTMPTEIGMLTNLLRFHLQDNRFSGTIPSEMLNIDDRYEDSTSRLEMNNFTGVAPFCEGNNCLYYSTVDCDKVACPCCTICM